MKHFILILMLYTSFSLQILGIVIPSYIPCAPLLLFTPYDFCFAVLIILLL